METATPSFAQLKAGLKAAWSAGDFGQIANHTAPEAENFVARLQIKPGSNVLDVACGTGNTAIPAARAGASVTGVDIAANLLEQATHRAENEKLKIRFDEGDAEELPYPDQSFDVVLSMFGAMFAPRPDRVAAELIRVCKPGGVIAMANWTPQGSVGKAFHVMAKAAPPPPNVPPPLLWGDEPTVRQRLASGASQVSISRHKARMTYPFSPKEMVVYFRQYFGPTQVAFARLDPAGQNSLSEQLESVWSEHNLATDGTTAIEAEYLDVRAYRA